MNPIYLIQRMRHNITISQLITGISTMLVITVLGKVFTFASRVILARFIGEVEYGAYSYALSWLQMLALIATVGLTSGSIQIIPTLIGRNELGIFKEFMIYSWKRVGYATIIIAVVMSLLIQLMDSYISVEVASTLSLIPLIIPIYSSMLLLSSQLLAMKQVVWSQLPQQVGVPLLFIITIIAIKYFLSNSINANTSFIVYGGIVLLIGLIFAIKLFMKFPSIHTSSANKRFEWNKITNEMLAFDVIRLVVQKIDLLLIGMMLKPFDIGIYAAVIQVSIALDFGLNAIDRVVSPMISEAYAQEKFHKLQLLATTSAAGGFSYTIILLILFIIFGQEILGLFGPSFRDGYIILLVISLGRCANAATGLNGYLLLMTNNQTTLNRIILYALIIIVPANIILIKLYGLLGAALASMFSIILVNVLSYIAVKRILTIDSSILSILKFLRKR